ncbi:MAG: glucose-6-phosphate isomerase [Rhabdochlamydiaceae bacterium]|nr:glucose-6-phosphate isomerase [Rhabdochlamydiaceae bacterium]
MTSFSHLKSVIHLNELAEDPYDLTLDINLQPKRIDSMLSEALGLKLFYGTERVSDITLQALFDLAEETKVLDKMHKMQSGEVMNRIEGCESEERKVLHTAMRDFFEQTNEAPVAKEASQLAYQELEKLVEFLRDLEKNDNFTDMVQVGIGGSDLGPRAIYLALKAYEKPNRRAHFFSNVDPDDGFSVLKDLDLSKTLFVVVSKSGSTLETRTNEELVRFYLQKAGLDPKNHLIAVTGKGSPMDDPSRYLASFYIWDYIGGRYSVTSMVGCVILAFSLGMDRVLSFLRGASSMDKLALKPQMKGNLPLLSALLSVWNRNFLGCSTSAVIPYSQALSRFPAHLQQLNMESNGKRIDKRGHDLDFDSGPVIWGEPGTNGQHSFFQLIHQGTSVVPVEFLGFCQSQYKEDVLYQGTYCQEKLLSNLFAQSLALATGQKSSNPNKVFPGNRPSRVLLGSRLDPYTLGQILSYYENSVAFQGFLWNINSFDQEGVQLGKVLASQCIDLFAQQRAKKTVDVKSFPLGYAYVKHVIKEEFQ